MVASAPRTSFSSSDSTLCAEAREVRPLVHAVVDDPPAEALAQALGERRPERDLHEADRVAHREVRGERLEGLDERVEVGRLQLAAVDVRAARRDRMRSSPTLSALRARSQAGPPGERNFVVER